MTPATWSSKSESDPLMSSSQSQSRQQHESLQQKSCTPCEGEVSPLDPQQAQQYLQALPEWSLEEEGKIISRKLNCGNFVKGVRLIQKIADVAESEQHHPDLHLTGYRKLRVDLTTHAIGGLSENDFILAAKVDALID